MNIAVCIKQILDPELHPNRFEVDRAAKRAVERGMPLVLSPYDENAIEAALQVKGLVPDTMVTALTLGGESAGKVLHRALGMGCDGAIWLSDHSWEDLDSFGIAKVLGRGIKKLGRVDVVLCGRQAGDWDMGQVGYLLAEELSLPCVSGVYNFEPGENGVFINREFDDGMETVKVQMPFLAIVTNHSSNLPRLPTVGRLAKAIRKELPVWSTEELDLRERIRRVVTVDDIFVPRFKRHVEMIDGKDGAEKGRKLVQRLLELKIL
jgi:electron transfer flavoprotein beta subunit